MSMDSSSSSSISSSNRPHRSHCYDHITIMIISDRTLPIDSNNTIVRENTIEEGGEYQHEHQYRHYQEVAEAAD
jgi:hypothetical protein